ncbi:cobalamin biosynthesis protein [Streptomyces phytohabitans]|uniref:cobalamin biosynthesis protein n=1 Tax=Streptomyces phytohabitans TaxID=1150371 RepID=UPI00387EE14C
MNDAAPGPCGALPWPAEGAVTEVARAVREGLPVRLRAEAGWPGAGTLPPHVRATVPPGTAHTLRVTDRTVPLGPYGAALRPPSLTVGVGARPGVSAAEVVELVERALADAELSYASVTALATVAARADEPGLLGAAARFGVPLRAYPADVLAAVRVPGAPSAAARAAVGTPSVAEAAALHAARAVPPKAPPPAPYGPELPVPKRLSAPHGRTARATAAVARRPPAGWPVPTGRGAWGRRHPERAETPAPAAHPARPAHPGSPEPYEGPRRRPDGSPRDTPA